ncbi:MAG: hypothetical protein WC758_00590 [Candidatus Woesearchaeota archaeon]|jgi:hypothetical protein
MSNLETEIGPLKIITNLAHYLDERNRKIIWGKYCWKDGNNYYGDELAKHKDSDFSTTHYISNNSLGITLEYNIYWDKKTSYLVIKLERGLKINLSPYPENIAVFSKNLYKDEELLQIPIIQIKYDVFSGPSLEDAKGALLDFSKNAATLQKYFTGMSNDSLEQYLKLVSEIKEFKNNENILRFH